MRAAIQRKLVRVRVNDRFCNVDPVWDACREGGLGMNGFDVAAYCSDSISIWPCGIAVNADSKSDVRHCSCPICANVRTAVAAPKQISRQEYEELIRTASALLAVCGFKLNLIPDVESDDDQKSVTASGEITNIP